jgi:hypothetical protein
VLLRPGGSRSLHVGLGVGTAVKGMQRLGVAAGEASQASGQSRKVPRMCALSSGTAAHYAWVTLNLKHARTMGSAGAAACTVADWSAAAGGRRSAASGVAAAVVGTGLCCQPFACLLTPSKPEPFGTHSLFCAHSWTLNKPELQCLCSIPHASSLLPHPASLTLPPSSLTLPHSHFRLPPILPFPHSHCRLPLTCLQTRLSCTQRCWQPPAASSSCSRS